MGRLDQAEERLDAGAARHAGRHQAADHRGGQEAGRIDRLDDWRNRTGRSGDRSGAGRKVTPPPGRRPQLARVFFAAAGGRGGRRRVGSAKVHPLYRLVESGVGVMRTQVGIIGAGPAGLFLAHLLQREGIECGGARSPAAGRPGRPHPRRGAGARHRPPPGARPGSATRMEREGLVHHGIACASEGANHRVNFAELVDGRGVVVWGQHEVVKDLIAARLRGWRRHPLRGLRRHARPISRASGPASGSGRMARATCVDCDVIAGCDGFHGISRPSIPAGVLQVFERLYPFAWLGILAEAPPPADELIYAHHPSGFALASMRSPARLPALSSRSAPDEDLADWSDARIWDELDQRLVGMDGGVALAEGPVLQKGVTVLRSFVVEPMRYGRLFLAGDAAHVVPPTGAKGMNLGDRRRRGAGARARRLLQDRRDGPDRPLFGDLPAPGVGGAALLLVDDPASAPRAVRHAVRPAPPARRARTSRRSRAAAAALAEAYVGPPLERL